jgi:glycosyltransferase involved in cell wall biosynthesis
MATEPVVTIAVPSYQQGHYLEDALKSIFKLKLPVEVFIADAGSTDGSVEIIRRWEDRITSWRSCTDGGQAAAINESIAKGRAPYVCWLNSDDVFLPGGLIRLIDTLEREASWPAAYGQAWNVREGSRKMWPVRVEPFDPHRLALRCIICQPASLIRRAAWEAVGGLNEDLHMAMDYDLWWRLYYKFGPLGFVEAPIAINRQHPSNKTLSRRRQHYAEAIKVVRRHYGRVPLKWTLAQPYAVWFKGLATQWEKRRQRGKPSLPSRTTDCDGGVLIRR